MKDHKIIQCPSKKSFDLYCTYNYWYENENKIKEKWDIFSITGSNTILQINFGFDYNLHIEFIEKWELDRIKERELFDDYMRAITKKSLLFNETQWKD